MRLETNLHASRILFQKEPRYESTCTFKAVSEVWAKYNDLPTKILKLHATTNSSEQKLKVSVWTVKKNKLKKDEFMQAAIHELWNFSGRNIISGYEFEFSLLNAFTVDTK